MSTPQQQITNLFNELITNMEEQLSAPTVTDDGNSGYNLLSYWLHDNGTDYDFYICRDNTVGAATWHLYLNSTSGPLLDDFKATLRAEVMANIINGAIDRSDVYLFENSLSGFQIQTAIDAATNTANAAQATADSNESKVNTFDYTDFSEYGNEATPTFLEANSDNKAGVSFPGSGSIQPMGLGKYKPALNTAVTARIRGNMKTADLSKAKTFQFAFVDDSEAIINYVELTDETVPDNTGEFTLDFVNVLTAAQTASQLIGRYELKVLDAALNNHPGDYFLIDVEIIE